MQVHRLLEIGKFPRKRLKYRSNLLRARFVRSGLADPANGRPQFTPLDSVNRVNLAGEVYTASAGSVRRAMASASPAATPSPRSTAAAICSG